jgi:hypothetical protein
MECLEMKNKLSKVKIHWMELTEDKIEEKNSEVKRQK